MLDGDAGGVADVAVFVARVEPGGVNGLGVLAAVVRLQFVSQRVERPRHRASRLTAP